MPAYSFVPLIFTRRGIRGGAFRLIHDLLKQAMPAFTHLRLTNNPMYQEKKKLKRRKQIPSYSSSPGIDEAKAQAKHRTQQTFDYPCIFQNIKFKAKDRYRAIGNYTNQAYDTYCLLKCGHLLPLHYDTSTNLH